ncbi:MAG: helix-turn-helix transcriptional regulator, partial [Moraxellaceae bacterium]
ATLCGVNPSYGCAQNMIMVRLADADRPLAMYDARLTRMLEDQCKIQLDRRQIVGLTGKVREQLLGKMGLVASLEDVAEHLAISPRSLRRKLEDEGTTFRGLVDHERKLLAAQLLETTQMKLDELGLHLGYADTASFTRAFRRWYGTSPGDFRSRRAHDA